MQNQKVILGEVDNVYTRQTVTLAPYEIKEIPSVHTFLRVYDTSGNIEIAAQNTGMFQTITAGTWIKNPNDENGNPIKLPYIRIKNLENFSVTVDIAMSNGEVGDDAFMGSAEVENYETSPLFVQDARPSNFKVSALVIPANDSLSFTPSSDMVEYIIQNQGSVDVSLLDTNGLTLYAGADFTGNLNKTFSIYNQSGSSAAVSITEFLK